MDSDGVFHLEFLTRIYSCNRKHFVARRSRSFHFFSFKYRIRSMYSNGFDSTKATLSHNRHQVAYIV